MKFQSSKYSSAGANYYQKLVAKNPFLYFGLPFVSLMIAGSFVLAPVTATKYENHDRKQRWVTNQEAFDNSGLQRRKFDAREEYYKLAARDLDNWEQKRVERLPGEPDGIL